MNFRFVSPKEDVKSVTLLPSEFYVSKVGRNPSTGEAALRIAQGLADGETMEAIGAELGKDVYWVRGVLTRWKNTFKLKSSHQFVAHCLRNRWID